MDEILLALLRRLKMVAESNHEIFNSEVREQMGATIARGFLRQEKDFDIPTQFGMMSHEADHSIHSALIEFVSRANTWASEAGLSNFFDRLDAFQNDDIELQPGMDYEAFFGHSPREFYDKNGNVIV